MRTWPGRPQHGRGPDRGAPLLLVLAVLLLSPATALGQEPDPAPGGTPATPDPAPQVQDLAPQPSTPQPAPPPPVTTTPPATTRLPETTTTPPAATTTPQATATAAPAPAPTAAPAPTTAEQPAAKRRPAERQRPRPEKRQRKHRTPDEAKPTLGPPDLPTRVPAVAATEHRRLGTPEARAAGLALLVAAIGTLGLVTQLRRGLT